MTITEAYEFTLEKINELKNHGIEIKIQRPDSKKELADKLPFKLWRQINFVNLSDSKADEILAMAKYLNLCGIQFDAGGMGNNRDWELDWSFRLGKEDEQWIEAFEECEEEIRNRTE